MLYFLSPISRYERAILSPSTPCSLPKPGSKTAKAKDLPRCSSGLSIIQAVLDSPMAQRSRSFGLRGDCIETCYISRGLPSGWRVVKKAERMAQRCSSGYNKPRNCSRRLQGSSISNLLMAYEPRFYAEAAATLCFNLPNLRITNRIASVVIKVNRYPTTTAIGT